ncbi:GntR family transcriptional regulator [Roseibium sediminicola]|uniref:GntR family transcriptional regulator n=1 Tax=Roseibium sediminicola TaxID=2933272 RepID=A0ABT0H3V6_9HYPH|nr:GntR family transcriptional regulator [Roseibium sp. CAU 1639]MCK7616140.1 GntR family transcriptional regulator [Roseibium sp. CAU 1639]
MSNGTKDRSGNTPYRTLRERILTLELRPGSVLDEASLTRQLDVSRTPIREAIIQLIADGLVVREGRSARVAPLDIDDIPPLYDALLISSRMIQRLAAEFRTEADLQIIREKMTLFENAIPSQRGAVLSEANYAFHLAISASAKNRYFSEFYERVLIGSLRFNRACFSGNVYATKHTKEHLSVTAEQHRDILQAIENGDIEEADRLAVEHHRLARHRLEKVLSMGALAISDQTDLSLVQSI